MGVWVFPSLFASDSIDAVTPGATSACPASVGAGGDTATNQADTLGGNGCVVIETADTIYTFTYTGAVETWSVPSGVTSVKVHAVGAGGGGGRSGTPAYGGGGGYIAGTINVTAGQQLDIIVGQGGTRMCTTDIAPLSPESGRYHYSFGGGGMGNGLASYDCSFASGGGRSAIRISGLTEDLVTAGGGGGGGYSGAGGAGGGTTGATGGACGGTGGTQTAGGDTCATEPGVPGIKYAGGWAGFSTTDDSQASEGGGGGGGYYGGGAAGDNGGGGGGSSYIANLIDATTSSGNGRTVGVTIPSNNTPPSIAGDTTYGGTVIATGSSWNGSGISTYVWQVSTDGVVFTDIEGATSDTYVVGVSGYLRVVETRTSLLGNTAATSSAVTIVAPPTTTTTTTSTTTSTSSTSTTTSTTTTTSPSESPTTTTEPAPVIVTTTIEPDGTQIAVATTTTSSTTTTTTTTIPQVTPSADAPTGEPPSKDPFDVQDGKPRFLQLKLTLAAGEPVSGKSLTSEAGGLKPGSNVRLELHSTPILLGERPAGTDGSVRFDSVMPDSIEPGMHRLILTGTTTDGFAVSATAAFEVDQSGIVTQVVAASESLSGVPSEAAMARALSAGKPLYDTTANVATSASLAVSAVVILTVMGASSGGSSKKDEGTGSDESMSSDHTDPSEPNHSSQGSIDSLNTDAIEAADDEHMAWGDHSLTWRFPGGEHLHRVFNRIHTFVGTKSTLITRLVTDGHWMRASFGSLQLVPLLAGLGVGIAASASVQGVFAPTFAFVVVIVLLAMVDALAGALAWLGFVITAAVLHGVSGWFDVRTLLGLGVLFMGLPLLTNNVRPLRRDIENRLDRVDRLADYLMAPILVGFASSGLYLALNGLSGLQMVAQSDANALRWFVGFAVIARMAFEDIATHSFPKRLRHTTFDPTKGTPLPIDIGTIVLKSALYLLATTSFFGLGWETWLVVVLMAVVPMLKLFVHRFPNYEPVHKWFPRGVMRSVVMLFVGVWFAGWVLGLSEDPNYTKALAAVLLIPGIVIGVVDVIGRKSDGWPDTLWRRLIGGALWAYMFAVLFGFVNV